MQLSVILSKIKMGNIKQINIKNRTYYFFNDMINIKDFDPSLIKMDKKSYENIGIYIIGYITIKSISDSESISNENPLYLMIGEADGYIECSSTEKSNGNKYLTFASTDNNKKLLEKYTKLWDEVKDQIQKINNGNSVECNSIEYDRDYMTIEVTSDDGLPLNKLLKLRMLTVIVRSVFEEDGKYYPRILLDECLYEV